MADRKLNTGLTENEVRTAFFRALNDLSDAEVQALIDAEKTSRQQADAQLDQAVNQLSLAISAETAARESLQTLVAAQLDSGAKNLLTVSSGSNTTAQRYVEIPCTAKAGTYVLYFGHLESTDTESTTCSVSFKDASSADVASPAEYQFQRGDGVYKIITLKNDNLAKIRIYGANNYATSAGDIVTFTNAMFCTKTAWDISQAYVPYCPTVQQLYQALLSVNGAALPMALHPDLELNTMEVNPTVVNPSEQTATEPEVADA